MRVGDLGGKDEVYDEEGDLILKPGEQLVQRSDGDNIDVWKGRHGLSSKTLVTRTEEKGTMFITDRRLVFIREPDPSLYYKSHSDPFSLPEGLAGSRYAADLKGLGLRIFAEIPYDEVISFRSHRKGKWIELRLEDEEGVPVRADINRLGKDDNKVRILEELLLQAGAKKLN